MGPLDVIKERTADQFQICIVEDDWLRERLMQETRWEAELTNGLMVYQDDERPGVLEPSAWLRLKKYCKAVKCGIKFMRFHFRTHCEDVGRDADAFFFRKAVLGSLGFNGPPKYHKPIFYYIGGIIKEGKLQTVKWHVPELIVAETTERNIEESEESLIWDYGKKTAELSAVKK